MKPALFALCAALLAFAFVAGMHFGSRAIPALEARATQAEHERDELRRTKLEVSAWLERARPTSTATTPKVQAPTPEPPPTEPAFNEISLEDLTKMQRAQAQKSFDAMKSKADLSQDQLEALRHTVDEMNRALDAPVQALEQLDKAESYSLSEWADANMAALVAIKKANEDFLASLSPQQRELVAQTDFQVTSQANDASYWRLVTLGAINLDTDADESSPEIFTPHR
jgi:hypothetical protein